MVFSLETTPSVRPREAQLSFSVRRVATFALKR